MLRFIVAGIVSLAGFTIVVASGPATPAAADCCTPPGSDCCYVASPCCK